MYKYTEYILSQIVIFFNSPHQNSRRKCILLQRLPIKAPSGKSKRRAERLKNEEPSPPKSGRFLITCFMPSRDTASPYPHFATYFAQTKHDSKILFYLLWTPPRASTVAFTAAPQFRIAPLQKRSAFSPSVEAETTAPSLSSIEP